MSYRKQVLVVGAGAIGGVFASFLNKVSDVVIYDVNQAHVDAINKNGLKVTGASESVSQIPAHADATELAQYQFDGVMLSVKGMFTQDAVMAIKPYIQDSTLMFTIQNGQGNVETIEKIGNWDIIHGITIEGAQFIGPGEVEHLVHGEESWVGPARGSFEKTRWFGELVNAAGIKTRVVPDPRGAIWSKFIMNAVANPIGALQRGVPEAMYQNDEVFALIESMMEEGTAVARAKGVELLFDPMEYLRALHSGKAPPMKHAGSMSYDIDAGRQTEIEFLTGYLVRAADESGVDVPVSRAIYRLLKGLEFGNEIKKQAGN